MALNFDSDSRGPVGWFLRSCFIEVTVNMLPCVARLQSWLEGVNRRVRRGITQESLLSAHLSRFYA